MQHWVSPKHSDQILQVGLRHQWFLKHPRLLPSNTRDVKVRKMSVFDTLTGIMTLNGKKSKKISNIMRKCMYETAYKSRSQQKTDVSLRLDNLGRVNEGITKV